MPRTGSEYGGTSECRGCGPGDDDGTLSLTDAIVSLGVLFLGEGAIPPPGMSNCGVDPTADGIGCGGSGSCP